MEDEFTITSVDKESPAVVDYIPSGFDSVFDTVPLKRKTIVFDGSKNCGNDIAVLDSFNPWVTERDIVLIPLIIMLHHYVYNTDQAFTKDLRCQYYGQNGQTLFDDTFETSERETIEHGEISYIILLCHVPLHLDHTKIHKVSLTRSSADVCDGRKYDVNQAKQERLFNLAACVSPVHSQNGIDNIQTGLLEWFEYHRESGIDHFYVYMGKEIGTRTRSILELYQALGFVTLIDWSIYSVGDWLHKGWNVNQNGALNDCLYRFRGESKYMINFDIDEFIFGNTEEVHSATDLIKFWEKTPEYHSTTHIVLLNWFYSTQLNANPKGNNLLISQMTHREKDHVPMYHREKILYKANSFILHVLIHHPGYDSNPYRLDASVAYLAHFQSLHKKLNDPEHSEQVHTAFAEQPMLDKVELRVATMEYLLQLDKRGKLNTIQ